MISLAKSSQTDQILTVLKRSKTQLCEKDHGGSECVLNQWLSNKTTENCLKWMSDENSATLVALSGDSVIGVGKIDKSGYLHHCYVSPDSVGKGVGSALLSALEDQAVKWKLGEINLESTATALSFYQDNGYCLIQVSKVFGDMDSFHMKKNIR